MNDAADRFAEGRRLTWIAIVSNGLLSAVKLAAGLFGNSQALVADAVHSLSDLFTDLVVLVGLKFAEKPMDDSHPYGHGRIETVGAGILGVILILTGLGIAWESIATLRAGARQIPSASALAAAFVSIVVKEVLYRYTVREGERTGSSALIANAWHHRSDAFSSVATLAGVGAAMAGWPVFDPLAALVVTLLILQVGWTISRDAFLDIIDTAVKPEVRDNIINAALSTPGAAGYHDLKTRKIGADTLVDIHIEVDPWMNVYEAHRIADEVKGAILNRVGNIADVLVHIDPVGEKEGLTYAAPKDDIVGRIERLVQSAEGIVDCGHVNLYYKGKEIIATLTVTLAPALTIREGHECVIALKHRILDIDGMTDAVITVKLFKEKENE